MDVPWTERRATTKSRRTDCSVSRTEIIPQKFTFPVSIQHYEERLQLSQLINDDNFE